MAISTKYGNIHIPDIGDDEPIFVLRAQDKLALPLIEIYDLLARTHGLKLESPLKRQIESFKQWSGTRKLPD